MSDHIGTRLDELPQSDIFEVSIAGVQAQLKRFFPKKDVPVVKSTGMNHFRALFRKNQKINRPFFVYMPSTAETPTEGYNSFILRRIGRLGPRLTSIVDGNTQAAVMYHFMPVNVAFRVLFLTDDSRDVNALVQRWLTAARHHYLNFQIDVEGDAPIYIKVNMDQNIQFPDLEMEEIGESYLVELTMNIDTYHGVIDKRVMVTTMALNLSGVDSQVDGSAVLSNFTQRSVRFNQP
jgi:hypothetical protein